MHAYVSIVAHNSFARCTHTHVQMHNLCMQICFHTRLTTHPPSHTEHGSNTHVQAPMPANESFFIDVMPLLSRNTWPLWVGQEPERSSGAPL
jgi:hypothetical protein